MSFSKLATIFVTPKHYRLTAPKMNDHSVILMERDIAIQFHKDRNYRWCILDQQSKFLHSYWTIMYNFISGRLAIKPRGNRY